MNLREIEGNMGEVERERVREENNVNNYTCKRFSKVLKFYFKLLNVIYYGIQLNGASK